MPDDPDLDVLDEQSLAVSLAASEIATALYDAIQHHPRAFPADAVMEVCVEAGRRAKLPLQRLAFRAFSAGVDQGERNAADRPTPTP